MGRIGTTELLVILLKALGTSLREFRAELNKNAEKENEPAGTAVAEK